MSDTDTHTTRSALAIIQSELRAAKDKHNAFGGYSYRNKESILEAVKPLLARTSSILNITEDLLQLGNRYYIKATASLRVGDSAPITASAFAREAETKKGMDEAQITGAASSYAGKYALCNLFAIDDSSLDPDSTNDHNKRLPSLDEINLIATSPNLEELKNAFRTLSLKNIAKGYLTDLCTQRKAQLSESSTSTPTA